MDFPPGLHQSNWIEQTCPLSIPMRLIESQITEWEHVRADTEVCGRGHQQIKRSRTLMTFPSPWHTPLRLVWVTRATMALFFILLKQLRQCCCLGPYAVPMAILKSHIHLSVGTPGKAERVVWGETLNRSPRIIFCYIVWDMTDTRALINSSQCDVAGREKVNQTGLFPPHNDRDSARAEEVI